MRNPVDAQAVSMADDPESKLKLLFTKLNELIENKQGGSKRAVRVIDDSECRI